MSFLLILVHTDLPLHRCYPTGHWYYCICKILSNSSATPSIYTNLKQGCIHSCRVKVVLYHHIMEKFSLLNFKGLYSDSHPQAVNVCFKLKLLHMDCSWWKPWKLQCCLSSTSISYMDMDLSRELFKKGLPSWILDSRPSTTSHSQFGRRSKSWLENKQLWMILHCTR